MISQILPSDTDAPQKYKLDVEFRDQPTIGAYYLSIDMARNLLVKFFEEVKV